MQNEQKWREERHSEVWHMFFLRPNKSGKIQVLFHHHEEGKYQAYLVCNKGLSQRLGVGVQAGNRLRELSRIGEIARCG